MKYLPHLYLSLFITFCCFSVFATPNGICNIDAGNERSYYGDETFYDWQDFHLGWYDPGLFKKDAMQYSNQKYDLCVDWCDSIAWDNVDKMAQDHLFEKVVTTTGKKVGWSCGGDSKCYEPHLAPNVKCYVEQVECETVDEECGPYFDIIRTFYLDCRGDVNCAIEHKPITDCCIVTKIVENEAAYDKSTTKYQKCMAECNTIWLTCKNEEECENKFAACDKKCLVNSKSK